MHQYILIAVFLVFGMCPLGIAGEARDDGKTKKAEKTDTLEIMVSKEKDPVDLEDVKEMVTKTMSGDVSARGPNGIAIVYERDKVKRSSQELYFPYEGEVELNGYKTKMDIEEGDKVTVTYDEAEDGSKRVLTGIRLVEKKPPEEEFQSDEADEEEQEAQTQENGAS